MKKMFVLMAVIAICQMGFSQQNPPAESNTKNEAGTGNMRNHKGKHDRRKMMSELNLTSDQKTKLKEMRMANKQKRDAIMNNSSLSETQKREQLKDLHKEHAKGLDTVLTDDQKAKMKSMKEQRKNDKKFRDGRLKQPEKAEKVIDNTNNQ